MALTSAMLAGVPARAGVGPTRGPALNRGRRRVGARAQVVSEGEAQMPTLTVAEAKAALLAQLAERPGGGPPMELSEGSDPARRRALSACIRDLEAAAGGRDAQPLVDARLGGNWRVAYDSSSDAAGGRWRAARTKDVVEITRLEQSVDLESTTVSNLLAFRFTRGATLAAGALVSALNALAFRLILPFWPWAWVVAGAIALAQTLYLAATRPELAVTLAGPFKAVPDADPRRVRVDFRPVRIGPLALASRKGPDDRGLVIGPSSWVELDTLFVDNDLRLGRGGRGTEFIFTRLPKTS